MAEGYEVWMVAPAQNQSGVGSAITLKPGALFAVKKVADKRYCFPGTPADSVDFGLSLLKNTPPDLVISGVNDGPNTGASQLNSGTLSAAVRALRYGFPAIAASIGYVMTPEEMKAGWPSTHKYWPDAMNHVVSLVGQINKSWQPGKLLLPAGTGLSINYPARTRNAVKGIKYIRNQVLVSPQLYYQMMPDGQAQQMINPDLLRPSTADTDTGWLDDGYITYTIFDGQWNASQYEKEYRHILKK